MTASFKRYLGLGLLASVVVVLGMTVLLAPHEPQYNGKGLREWSQQYGSNHWSSRYNGPEDKEAQAAIRQIGTNGIPFLLSLMEKRESSFWAKVQTITPRAWRSKLPAGISVERVRSIGAYGFAALGTNAAGAVPALIEIGRNHPDEQGRYNAVFALRTLKSASEPAIPFFIECLTNPVDIIRGDAAMGLGYVQLQPEVAVPALMQYLERSKSAPNSFESVDAVEALARFGTNAKAALPLLISMLDTKNPRLLECLTNRLPLIDPQSTAEGHADAAQ